MENRPSATAHRVALRRAAHQILDRPCVHEDSLALRIVGAKVGTLPADAQREGDRLASFLRAFLAVRSRIAEDELAEAVSRGVRQYVVLGAGLDTFAYRNPYPEFRVFELDHPATQAWKRERLAAADIAVPAGVTLAPIDFASQDLVDVLRDAGLAAERPTFFSWLGVTPYLEPAIVLATLTTLAPLAQGGGGIVFDYSVPPDSLDANRRAAFDRRAFRVRAAGEPFRGFFEPRQLLADIKDMGYRHATDLGPDELNARYFAGRTDGLRVGSLGHVMMARA